MFFAVLKFGFIRDAFLAGVLPSKIYCISILLKNHYGWENEPIEDGVPVHIYCFLFGLSPVCLIQEECSSILPDPKSACEHPRRVVSAGLWKLANERHSSVDRAFKPIIYKAYSFYGACKAGPAFNTCCRVGIVCFDI